MLSPSTPSNQADSNRQVSVFTVDIGRSGPVRFLRGSQGFALDATPIAAPSVEKISCTCGAQIRYPLPGYDATEANGVELTRGERENLKRNGGRGIPEYDTTNCTGRSKQRVTRTEWLLEQRRAVAEGSNVSKVSPPVLPQDYLYVLHCDDLNSMAEARKADEEAKKRALTEQDTILEDTQGLRGHSNEGGGSEDRPEPGLVENVDTVLSDTGDMRWSFHQT